MADHLDQRIPQWLEQYNVPGAAVSLVRNGEVVSSEGYGLADRDRGILVIGKVTGESFSAYTQREVLDPLGMVRSSFEWWADLRPATAVAYSRTGGPRGFKSCKGGDMVCAQSPLGMRIPIANCDQTRESGSSPVMGVLTENHH